MLLCMFACYILQNVKVGQQQRNMAVSGATSMMSSSMTPYKYNSGISVASAVKSVQAKRMLNVYIEVSCCNNMLSLYEYYCVLQLSHC
jgi:hypothetical protein